MKVAITGGGNTYALNFTRHLAALGIDHFGIGRTGPKAEPFWQVDHDYRFYQLHMIRDFDAVMTCIGVERPDIVVNFAAQGESAASFGPDAHLFYATNAAAMVRFASALMDRGHVQQFVQISTSELYGSVNTAVDEFAALRPSSPYAISKAAFDQHLQAMWRVHGFPAKVVRPSNCYCPGQQLHRVIPQAAIAAIAGRRMQLQAGGKVRKSYLHASDLSRGIWEVIDRGRLGEVYNCGPDQPTWIRNLVAEVAVACGVSFDALAEVVPARQGEDGCYWLDSSKLKRETGWQQSINLQDGLMEMVKWVKRYPELMTADATYRIAE